MDPKILSTLDRAANKLRNKIEGQDYFKVLLSLIFIKFLTTKTEIDWKKFKEKNIDDYKQFILEKGEFDINVTMIDEKYLWSTLRSSTDEELKINLDGVFSSLEKYQKECKGMDIYKFSTSDVSSVTIRQIIEIIEENIKFDTENYIDIFGQIYEYFIAKYSTDAGRGGEFYTPHTIVNLMVAITEGRFDKNTKQLKIYDPTMGSAGMLVQSLNYLTKEKEISKDKLLFFGQELKNSTWSIAKMNFVLRGVQWDFGNKNDDTFANDMFKDKKFDVILSNPPFNLPFPEEDYHSLVNDERFKEFGLIFGSAGANYNFFNHILYHLETNGVAAVIMQPAAGKSAREKDIRIKYLNENLVEAIISLPQNVFSNTSIASNIWIFNKNKTRKDILFVDLQDETTKENKQEIISDKIVNEVKNIFESFINNEEIISKINYAIETNENILKNFDAEISVSNHAIRNEEIEVFSKEEILKEYNEIIKSSKEIDEKMKKAIKLLE